MIETINIELTKLTRSVDLLEKDQAKKIVETIVEEIVKELGAHICDVFLVDASRDGLGSPKPFLDPFTSIDKANRQRSGPYNIEQSDPGVWSWVYKTKRPIWLKELISRDKSKPKKHVISDDLVEPEYLKYPWPKTDSIIVIPLLENDKIWGILSIELPEGKKVSEDTYTDLVTLGIYLTRIIWKSDTYLKNRDGTEKAIKEFSEHVGRKIEVVPYDIKTAFIIRPFEDKFETIDTEVRKFLTSRQIRILGYAEGGLSRDGLDNILNQILKSHLIIADLTGFNTNVMTEIGIAIGARKSYVLFHEQIEDFKPPFDLGRNVIYLYKTVNSDLIFVDPGIPSAKILVEQIFQPVLDELDKDPDYSKAKPYKSFQA